MFKKKTGITLIALIITVIVLLILAGVTINMVMGENGIFTKSQMGISNYKKSSTEEKVKIEINNYKIAKFENPDLKFDDFIAEDMNDSEISNLGEDGYKITLDNYDIYVNKEVSQIYAVVEERRRYWIRSYSSYR